eukprot:CAMPEP_0198282418 /NCGR_PEP_ID=MMETSP1449-20131203/2249_1 /TAXON_ID=420275 /ORGANISM="Attheya septentrionalis, Strain CCMP2084" /LENGTH=246 /DNA_ID=CAMNT_0043978673 /DNA_START=161 /DNA_END=898 /DNA_ORIENTATION=+
MIAGTLQTDPRSGGVKKSSGVNVLPIVAETWSEVRDNSNNDVDWLIAGYDKNSKTDITVIFKGSHGIEGCSKALPDQMAVFGGCRLKQNGRFVTFFHCAEGTSPMQRGRASMHKNGVLNVLEGSDCEIDMKPGITEETLTLPIISDGGPTSMTAAPVPRRTVPKSSPSPTPPPVAVTPSSDLASNVQALSISVEGYIPYEQLKTINDVSDLPSGVDLSTREEALSDEEFLAVFGIDKETFRLQPAW